MTWYVSQQGNKQDIDESRGLLAYCRPSEGAFQLNGTSMCLLFDFASVGQLSMKKKTFS